MIVTSREERRALKRENAKQSATLERMEGWQDRPNLPPGLIEVWRSRDFLVQVYGERDGIVRMSVNRATLEAHTGRWHDNITWDELQRCKSEIGRGHLDAVEIFPADRDVMNVANMRHLFIMPELLPYAWRKSQ